jgi:uncharacterized membrane protein YdbT with pleckstrin-like domain
MYKESIANRQGRIKYMFFVVGMSLFTVSLFDYFSNTQFSWIYELIIIAIAAFIISIIIKNVSGEYTYSIIENEFIIKSIVGKREITIASMKFKQITRFAKK